MPCVADFAEISIGGKITDFQLLDNKFLHSLRTNYPQRFVLRVTSAGDKVTFVFHQNRQLLSSEYLSSRNVSSSNALSESFCHYLGNIFVGNRSEIGNDSPSAISICDGRISGFLIINHQFFGIESDEDGLVLTSARYLANQSNSLLKPCDTPVWGQIPFDLDNSTLVSGEAIPAKRSDFVRIKRQERANGNAPTGRPTKKVPDYYKQYLDGNWRFVELALVSDHEMFGKYHKDTDAVHKRMVSIANAVDALFRPVNIRIILVWAEVWEEGDTIPITEDADQTLSGFLNYRKSMLREHPHDNAHLLTNMQFDGGVVGKANKGTMCSYDYSGGINVDHSRSMLAVAATVAHEMGHNFGMEHDNEECMCEHGRNMCIMAASTGGSPPAYWSDCSLEYLQHGLKRGLDYCLKNQPRDGSGVFGGARCGNGIVEGDEDCDCGGEEVCFWNKCCDPKTCKFVGDAKCASGLCCDTSTCKPKPAATPCRSASNNCDLPEFCDGHFEFCPADFFVRDGQPCPGGSGNSFCLDGHCGGRDEQCRQIWGPTGKGSKDVCYKQLNPIGDQRGNCGYNHETQKFFKCKQENVMCGRLQCEHRNEAGHVTEYGDRSITHSAGTTIQLHNGQHVSCWMATMRMTDKKDPGMVPDGAPCGDDKICVNAKCVPKESVTKMVAKCDVPDCHGYGVCNNMGNCHCHCGYFGKDCGVPGPGGSINSGPMCKEPVFNGFVALFCIVLVGSIIFGIFSYFYHRRTGVWPHKKIFKYIRAKNTEVVNNLRRPVRKAPPPPLFRESQSPSEQQCLNYQVKFSALDAKMAWNGGTQQQHQHSNSGYLVPSTGHASATLGKHSSAAVEISPPIPQSAVPGGTDGKKFGTLPSNFGKNSLVQNAKRQLEGAAKSTQNHTQTLNRQPSLRPKERPPPIPQRPDEEILQDLYVERSQELGSTDGDLSKADDAEHNSLVNEVMSAIEGTNGPQTAQKTARYRAALDESPPPDDPEQKTLPNGYQTAGGLKSSDRSSSDSLGGYSSSRPGKPPPPPPKAGMGLNFVDDNNYYDVIPAHQPVESDNDKPGGTGGSSKPPLPAKPPVAAKPKVVDAPSVGGVKSLAARYDPKSGNTRTKLWNK